MRESRSLSHVLRQALTQAWNAQGDWRINPVGGFLVLILRPISGLFATLVAIRRHLYQRGIYKSQTLPVPVVVVGNVMVGGVGKTPVTMALVNHLKAQGWHVGVLSRGYGRKTSHTLAVVPSSDPHHVGDEPLLIARSCQVPVFVGTNRVDAGRTLLALHPEVQILVCDDGLQHLALARDLELCVFDERDLGNGHLLPAGPLREAWPRTPQHHALSNTDIPCWVVRTSGKPGPNEFMASRHLADYACQADGTQRPLSHWQHATVQALAGIAKPEAFFAMLRDKGLTLAQAQALPDHADMQTMTIDPTQGDVLCTEKDAVKLWKEHPHVWAVPLQTTLPSELLAAIDHHLAAAQHAKLSSPHGQQTA